MRMLAAANLGGALLSSQHNFSLAHSRIEQRIDLNRQAGAGGLLVRKDGKCFVLANRIEMPRLLAEALSPSDFEPVEYAWEEEQSTPTFVVDKALTLLHQGAALGSDIELDSNTPVIEAAIAQCRYQLTAAEVERFRRLGFDAGQAISELVNFTAGSTSRRYPQAAAPPARVLMQF